MRLIRFEPVETLGISDQEASHDLAGLVRDVADMAAVMRAVSGLSADACREAAARRFSANA
ncbi:hypothetical protein JMJ55_22875 [Belnapia sp. T6]|uniref:Uncharacterized protein n=1 Tax=Belnapia mucosa TaxID=2804532 RepID=A0ABS1V941_9PROT|nr:hypothetical protein [Belnapia mucosa]MBL6458185.1 hypothetical protein [Belnapia mucosa]